MKKGKKGTRRRPLRSMPKRNVLKKGGLGQSGEKDRGTSGKQLQCCLGEGGRKAKRKKEKKEKKKKKRGASQQSKKLCTPSRLGGVQRTTAEARMADGGPSSAARSSSCRLLEDSLGLTGCHLIRAEQRCFVALSAFAAPWRFKVPEKTSFDDDEQNRKAVQQAVTTRQAARTAFDNQHGGCVLPSSGRAASGRGQSCVPCRRGPRTGSTGRGGHVLDFPRSADQLGSLACRPPRLLPGPCGFPCLPRTHFVLHTQPSYIRTLSA